MPRLTAETLQDRRDYLQATAMKCFLRQGYNAVSIRDIAKAAKVSLGNLYNHYPDKKALFVAILKSESKDFLSPQNPVISHILQSQFPDDLEGLGHAIKNNVEEYSNYFKLMYIDLIEFKGVHIRELFSNLDVKFKKVLRTRFKVIGRLGQKRSVDPCFAFIAAYMSFYQYFILTKLFGAKNVFGKKSDEEFVREMTRTFVEGMRRG